jgi:hypothetical protein
MAFVKLESFEAIVEIIVLYHGCQVYRSGSKVQHHRGSFNSGISRLRKLLIIHLRCFMLHPVVLCWLRISRQARPDALRATSIIALGADTNHA